MIQRYSFFILMILFTSQAVSVVEQPLLTDLFDDMQELSAAKRKQRQHEYETARRRENEHYKKDYEEKLEKWNSSLEGYRSHVKKWREYRDSQRAIDAEYGRFAHIRHYPTIADTLYTTFDRMQLRVSGSHAWAHAAYTSDSSVANLASVSVSENPVSISDIITASALANAGVLDANQGIRSSKTEQNFLSYLSTSPVIFAARHERTVLQFDVMYYLFDNLLAVGISVPYAQQRRAISMSPKISDTVRERIVVDATTEAFYKRYGVNVFHLIEDSINRQGMTYSPTFSRSGISDVTIYAQYRIGALHGIESVCSLGLEMPAADGVTEKQFYDAPMGNGGFIKVNGDVGVIARVSRVLTPYITLHGAYGFENNVRRRVVKKVSVPASHPSNLAYELFPFSEWLKVKTATTIAESSISHFGSSVEMVSVQPSHDISGRVGCVAHNELIPELQGELFYDCRLKTTERLVALAPSDVVDAASFRPFDYSIAHTIGGALTYQPAAEVTCSISGAFIVYGKNTPIESSVSAFVHWQW